MRTQASAILTAMLTALTPGHASAFSALDVLTLCHATHAEPGFVRDKLKTLGWQDITTSTTADVVDVLTLATLATMTFETRTSHSPSNWKKDWANAEKFLNIFLAPRGADRMAILREPETSSVILLNWDDGSARGQTCLLAVPEAATKPQSYHPKLQEPDGGNAFYTIAESSDPLTSRINGSSRAVSVDMQVVQTALGRPLDVVAVFSTRTSYPANAVLP